MRYVLENGELRAEIESFGAELKSLVRKETGQEFMWEADPAFWGKTSPVLFPFIGKLKGAEYRYQGTRYQAEKHGFARNMEFAVSDRGADHITFWIEDNKMTRRNFPFAFCLEITYRLKENTLAESWRVFNRGEETMFFSIGGHPAFACPVKGSAGSLTEEVCSLGGDGGSFHQSGKNAGAKRTDCFIKLYEAGAPRRQEDGSPGCGAAALRPFAGSQVDSLEVELSSGLLTGDTFPVAVRDSLIPVTEHIFDGDALCLEGQGVRAVGLCDREKREYVRLEADCPVWGIWSVPDSNAAYICLEPWWGVCDRKDYAGNLQERPHTNRVEAGGVWEQMFQIAVL